ncbi:translocation/assembly module TamB domain-containing protein [Paenalcaligenes sp. Me52]|uniref:translocation/assembly module TamB domain-containing protein n=1 Tax=Paenalcaligenes sp. Me52 TaxID=3392038 RepID=UPI003D285E23
MSKRSKKSFWWRLVFWVGPIVVMLLLMICGFLYWAVASQPGTQWLLRTAVSFVDGEVRGVRGSLWEGVQIDSLDINIPGTKVAARDAKLQVLWPALLQRKVHVRELSVGDLAVALETLPDEEPEPPSDTPFEMPSLPVNIQVDQLALGTLDFKQDGIDLPITVGGLTAAASLEDGRASVSVRSLDVIYEQIHAAIQLQARSEQLAAPWPIQAALSVNASTEQHDAVICAQQYLPGLAGKTPTTESADAAACEFELQAGLEGSLQGVKVNVDGKGQGVSLEAAADLLPEAAMPLRQALVNLQIGSETELQAKLDWSDDNGTDRIQGTVHSKNLDVAALLADASLPALLSLDADYDVRFKPEMQLDNAKLNLAVHDGSRWNGQPLRGKVAVEAQAGTAPSGMPEWAGYQLVNSDIQLNLGRNTVTLAGGFGKATDVLNLDVALPAAEQILASLSSVGAATVKGQIKGGIVQHNLALKAKYDLGGDASGQELGQGPVDVDVALDGNLNYVADQPIQWRAAVERLKVNHSGFGIQTLSKWPLFLQLPEGEQPLQFKAEATRIQSFLNDQPWVTLVHQLSALDGENWQTAGGLEPFSISPARLKVLQTKLGLDKESEQRGGVKDMRASSQTNRLEDLRMEADWNIRFQGALGGQISVRHLAGDIMIPAEPSFPLGLTELGLQVNLVPTGSDSRVQARLAIKTNKMGEVLGDVNALLRFTPEQGFHLRDSDLVKASVEANVADLGWTNLILGDAMELRGRLNAKLDMEMRPSGYFSSQGQIQGRELRVTRLDDGIRLMDGSLDARIDDQRFILDQLYFPAVLRVEPKEWRTATWISENPEAKGGFLKVSGEWDLENSTGKFLTELFRYPILQRADRYAMVSGNIEANLVMPQIALTGKVMVDAGWFNLDMLGGIPTIDSDIVVLRAGQTIEDQPPPSTTDLSMNVEVDLGPRFYLTGYGVNSGLVGQLRVSMFDGQLNGFGALRTRGGAIEQYGQRLQLRRGSITFQGDITNPILDIEALRTGLAVQAGVKVVGTARKPRIDLVSYPDVDNVEKLSWLLFGHGTDDNGSDLALLFSVGASFIGGDDTGEPFYRKFGVDEVTMKSGELGSAGSILPVESTIGGIDSGTTDMERQFLQISKQIGSNITLSLQQALSDTGTVGRASYQLTRRLTAELNVGTVNGLALVYRWFSSTD